MAHALSSRIPERAEPGPLRPSRTDAGRAILWVRRECRPSDSEDTAASRGESVGESHLRRRSARGALRWVNGALRGDAGSAREGRAEIRRPGPRLIGRPAWGDRRRIPHHFVALQKHDSKLPDPMDATFALLDRPAGLSKTGPAPPCNGFAHSTQNLTQRRRRLVDPVFVPDLRVL